MLLNLDNKDIEFIKKRYPLLKIVSKNPMKIEGALEFHAIYNDYEIKDSYDIKIESIQDRIFPRVIETGNKLKDVAIANSKKLEDMHVNINDMFSACLCPPIQEKIFEKQNISVTNFIEKYIVPFFYSQSYYKKTQQWAWGEYGHGIIGVLESYLDYSSNKETVLLFLQTLEEYCKKYGLNYNFYLEQLRQKKIKGRNTCPVCSSSNCWEKCCIRTLESMRKLKEDMNSFKIKK